VAARIVVPRRWTWAWRVEEVLGVARARRARRAIKRGEVAEEHFAAVGDDGDVEERTRATLDRLGLDHLELERRVGELSGGEAVPLGLAAQLLRRPGVLLDEPTNNLDLRHARRRAGPSMPDVGGRTVLVRNRRVLVSGALPLRLRYHLDRSYPRRYSPPPEIPTPCAGEVLPRRPDQAGHRSARPSTRTIHQQRLALPKKPSCLR
jgi:hypothetical protein